MGCTGVYERQRNRRSRVFARYTFALNGSPLARSRAGRVDRVGTDPEEGNIPGVTLATTNASRPSQPLVHTHRPFRADLRLLLHPEGMVFRTSEVTKGLQSNLAPSGVYIPLVIPRAARQGPSFS